LSFFKYILSLIIFSFIKIYMASASAVKKIRKKKVFPTDDDVAEAMAEYTFNLSKKFCEERDYFTVVISGGDLTYWLRKLLDAKYDNKIEWSKWHIFWVDERVVPLDDEDSNYKQALDRFFSPIPRLRFQMETSIPSTKPVQASVMPRALHYSTRSASKD